MLMGVLTGLYDAISLILRLVLLCEALRKIMGYDVVDRMMQCSNMETPVVLAEAMSLLLHVDCHILNGLAPVLLLPMYSRTFS